MTKGGIVRGNDQSRQRTPFLGFLDGCQTGDYIVLRRQRPESRPAMDTASRSRVRNGALSDGREAFIMRRFERPPTDVSPIMRVYRQVGDKKGRENAMPQAWLMLHQARSPRCTQQVQGASDALGQNQPAVGGPMVLLRVCVGRGAPISGSESAT